MVNYPMSFIVKTYIDYCPRIYTKHKYNKATNTLINNKIIQIQ